MGSSIQDLLEFNPGPSGPKSSTSSVAVPLRCLALCSALWQMEETWLLPSCSRPRLCAWLGGQRRFKGKCEAHQPSGS